MAAKIQIPEDMTAQAIKNEIDRLVYICSSRKDIWDNDGWYTDYKSKLEERLAKLILLGEADDVGET